MITPIYSKACGGFYRHDVRCSIVESCFYRNFYAAKSKIQCMQRV